MNVIMMPPKMLMTTARNRLAKSNWAGVGVSCFLKRSLIVTTVTKLQREKSKSGREMEK